MATDENALAPPAAPFWSWLRLLAGARWRRVCGRPARELRLRETLALGERRFLAVVEYEAQRFLIGGTGSSLALLAKLPAEQATEVDFTGEA